MFRGNKIYLVRKDGTKRRILGLIPGLFVKFKGHNSTLTLHEPLPKFYKSMIKLGDNCNVSIGSSKYSIKKLVILADEEESVCEIGKDFSCNSCEIALRPESGLKVKIGDDCMFARGIFIRTSDAHTIEDQKDSRIINYGKDIEIGDHVWLGNNVTVLKGAQVADNSVIGLGAVVSKSCGEANSIYAGVPAKLVKTGINWDRRCP